MLIVVFSHLLSEADVTESEEKTFSIRDTKLSQSVLKLLKNANLESHGYKREVSTNAVQRRGSYEKYFKASAANFTFRARKIEAFFCLKQSLF